MPAMMMLRACVLLQRAFLQSRLVFHLRLPQSLADAGWECHRRMGSAATLYTVPIATAMQMSMAQRLGVYPNTSNGCSTGNKF